MFEVDCMSYFVCLKFFFVWIPIVEILSTMTRKAKKDILTNWMDRETLESVSVFACGGGLDHTSINMGSSSIRGVFPRDGDKRICRKYDGCIIPFHMCLFFLIGLSCLPFNDIEISILNH